MRRLGRHGLESLCHKWHNHSWLCWFALAAVCFAQQKDVWPQFRGNYQLTGVSTSSVPKTLKLLWSYDAGEPVESSAAIVDGVVYIGSGAGYLSAIDLESGKLRWKYKVSQEGGGESSP